MYALVVRTAVKSNHRFAERVATVMYDVDGRNLSPKAPTVGLGRARR